MSKKVIRRKKAFFLLEPDGFSIHTIELSIELKATEYNFKKDQLYCLQQQSDMKGWFYKDEYKRPISTLNKARDEHKSHICTLYKAFGIREIRFEHNHSESKDFDTYFIRMVVNPRKLIDPQSSYIGILPPEKSSVKALKKAFAELFENAVFENNINAYRITRVDFCTNIHCDNKKIFRELVRVLRKLPTPPKYERKLYKHKDKKKANQYNKHYLRFHCGMLDLIIYDKTYQVQECGLVISYEKLPEGVLRFEVHCERDYVRELERELGCDKTEDLLWRLIQKSKSRIIKHFSWCFSDVRFVQMERIEQLIQESAFRKKNKDIMLKLATQLQRTQSVDRALNKLEKEGIDTSGLLDRFDQLGISPIPLWKNFCAKELPGPVELLRAMPDGELSVEYLKVKQK